MHRTLLSALARSIVAILIVLTPFAAAATERCPIRSGGLQTVPTAAGATPTPLYAPRGWRGEAPAPLLILLHGSTGTGANILKQSAIAEAADQHGFLVAAPDGGIAAEGGFVWNIPGVPTVTGTVPGPDDRDDVAYLSGMIDRMVAAGCVDPARIYVSGFSGGGRMASWLGCVAPERFAAIIPVVGLRAGKPDAVDPGRPDPATCAPRHPVTVIAFAGDADGTNPIAGGGAGYWQYSMHAAEQRWAALNGCAAAPVTRWVASGTYEERYAGCRDGTEVIGVVRVGEGHRWVADNAMLWALASRHRRVEAAP